VKGFTNEKAEGAKLLCQLWKNLLVEPGLLFTKLSPNRESWVKVQ